MSTLLPGQEGILIFVNTVHVSRLIQTIKLSFMKKKIEGDFSRFEIFDGTDAELFIETTEV